MPEPLLVPYKALKQKQKARISDWMYKETLHFFLEHQRMPDADEAETLCSAVCLKVQSSNSGWPAMRSGDYFSSAWMSMPNVSSGMPMQVLHWTI